MPEIAPMIRHFTKLPVLIFSLLLLNSMVPTNLKAQSMTTYSPTLKTRLDILANEGAKAWFKACKKDPKPLQFLNVMLPVYAQARGILKLKPAEFGKFLSMAEEMIAAYEVSATTGEFIPWWAGQVSETLNSEQIHTFVKGLQSYQYGMCDLINGNLEAGVIGEAEYHFERWVSERFGWDRFLFKNDFSRSGSQIAVWLAAHERAGEGRKLFVKIMHAIVDSEWIVQGDSEGWDEFIALREMLSVLMESGFSANHDWVKTLVEFMESHAKKCGWKGVGELTIAVEAIVAHVATLTVAEKDDGLGWLNHALLLHAQHYSEGDFPAGDFLISNQYYRLTGKELKLPDNRKLEIRKAIVGLDAQTMGQIVLPAATDNWGGILSESGASLQAHIAVGLWYLEKGENIPDYLRDYLLNYLRGEKYKCPRGLIDLCVRAGFAAEARGFLPKITSFSRTIPIMDYLKSCSDAVIPKIDLLRMEEEKVHWWHLQYILPHIQNKTEWMVLVTIVREKKLGMDMGKGCAALYLKAKSFGMEAEIAELLREWAAQYWRKEDLMGFEKDQFASSPDLVNEYLGMVYEALVEVEDK